MGTQIEVDDIHAGYNGEAVLKGISITLDHADFLGVIGPNGSGKTTLLRSMLRALPPTRGRITLDGHDIYSIPARKFARTVAVVPQDSFVAFDFTVLEITLMGRSPRLGRFAVESRGDVEIAMEALARTGTDHLAERSINSLSGGERQRVIVARALAQQPQIILLDEPTSHLDISFQYEIMDLIRSLNREQGLTVLAVLHDLNLASEYCDRLAMIGDGTIRAAGPPEEVITQENIRRVYGAEVWGRRHPTSHRPYVISGVTRKSQPLVPEFDRPLCVHVIGGGGTAAPILAKLARRGYHITAGVLSAGDADQEVAEALDIPHIRQPQFAQITADLRAKHRSLIESADIVVLTDVPVGHGNLANISAAHEAVSSGKRLIVLKPDLIGDRDFTDGQATDLVNDLLTAGALPADSVEHLLQLVEQSAVGCQPSTDS